MGQPWYSGSVLDCWSTGRARKSVPGTRVMFHITIHPFIPGFPRPSVALQCRIVAYNNNYFISNHPEYTAYLALTPYPMYQSHHGRHLSLVTHSFPAGQDGRWEDMFSIHASITAVLGHSYDRNVSQNIQIERVCEITSRYTVPRTVWVSEAFPFSLSHPSHGTSLDLQPNVITYMLHQPLHTGKCFDSGIQTKRINKHNRGSGIIHTIELENWWIFYMYAN